MGRKDVINTKIKAIYTKTTIGTNCNIPLEKGKLKEKERFRGGSGWLAQDPNRTHWDSAWESLGCRHITGEEGEAAGPSPTLAIPLRQTQAARLAAPTAQPPQATVASYRANLPVLPCRMLVAVASARGCQAATALADLLHRRLLCSTALVAAVASLLPHQSCWGWCCCSRREAREGKEGESKERGGEEGKEREDEEVRVL